MQEISELVKSDCKARNIDLSLNVDADVPESIGCDVSRFKQVMLNMIQWNVSSQLRGSIKVNVSFEAADGFQENDLNSNMLGLKDEESQGSIIIEFVNSKSDLKKKEAERLAKLGVETDFAKILESKTDVPFKVTKVIANAVDWQVDFNSYRSNRMSFRVPALKFTGAKETIEQERRFLDIIESNNMFDIDAESVDNFSDA